MYIPKINWDWMDITFYVNDVLLASTILFVKEYDETKEDRKFE